MIRRIRHPFANVRSSRIAVQLADTANRRLDQERVDRSNATVRAGRFGIAVRPAAAHA
jgi:hypothetical protein